MPARPSRAETSPSCMTPLPRQRRVLLVQGDDAAAQLLVLQRLAQDAGAVDGLAVVGEAERAGRRAARPSRSAPRRRRPRVTQARKPTGMRASRRAGLAQRAQDRRGVDRRARVRHRDDGDEAAGGRRARAGLEVLLVLLAGHAQVHVRVDEAREQVPALAVDRPRRRRRSSVGRAELGDLAVADEHVERARRARRAGRARGRRGSGRRRAASGGGRAGSCRLGTGADVDARRAAARRGPRAARRARPCGRRRRPRPAGRSRPAASRSPRRRARRRG